MWAAWPQLLALLLPDRLQNITGIASMLFKNRSSSIELGQQAVLEATDVMGMLQAVAGDVPHASAGAANCKGVKPDTLPISHQLGDSDCTAVHTIDEVPDC
jgi:hypothetical protein